MSVLRSDLITAVDRSPRATAAHDRAEWVGLFTDDGRVEDPVGSRPHVGPLQIGRFYDTFIEPRRIVFHYDADIVCGSTVVRDVVLEVGMGPTVTMRIPAVLRYDMRAVADEWRIERLRAYWELPAMMLQFLGNGLSACPQGLALTRSLLANQGVRGSAGFTSGFRGARFRGKRTVRAFLDAIAAGDELRAWRSLAPGVSISHAAGKPLKFRAFGEQVRGALPAKVLAAGSSVAVSFRGPTPRVLIAELARGGQAITALTYFGE